MIQKEYFSKNHSKFLIKYHIIFVCKYRKQLLVGIIEHDMKKIMRHISEMSDFDIEVMETDKDHVHILLGYDTTDSVCNIVKTLKQETTHHLWQRFGPFLSNHYWKKRIFWSDGDFACSIGEVSSAIIQKYIENQG